MKIVAERIYFQVSKLLERDNDFLGNRTTAVTVTAGLQLTGL